MVRHSEAIEAWNKIFKPTKKELRKRKEGSITYLDDVSVPLANSSLPDFPIWWLIEHSTHPIVEAVSSLFTYFKGMSDKKVVSYHQAQRLWLMMYPYLPKNYYTYKEYRLLLEYFTQLLHYTPINIENGRSLKSL